MKKLIIILLVAAFSQSQQVQASCITQDIEETMWQAIAQEFKNNPCCVAGCCIAMCATVEMVNLNTKNVRLQEENRKINLTNEVLLKVLRQQSQQIKKFNKFISK